MLIDIIILLVLWKGTCVAFVPFTWILHVKQCREPCSVFKKQQCLIIMSNLDGLTVICFFLYESIPYLFAGSCCLYGLLKCCLPRSKLLLYTVLMSMFCSKRFSLQYLIHWTLHFYHILAGFWKLLWIYFVATFKYFFLRLSVPPFYSKFGITWRSRVYYTCKSIIVLN